MPDIELLETNYRDKLLETNYSQHHDSEWHDNLHEHVCVPGAPSVDVNFAVRVPDPQAPSFASPNHTAAQVETGRGGGEKQRETDRQRDRQTDRQTDRETSDAERPTCMCAQPLQAKLTTANINDKLAEHGLSHTCAVVSAPTPVSRGSNRPCP